MHKNIELELGKKKILTEQLKITGVESKRLIMVMWLTKGKLWNDQSWKFKMTYVMACANDVAPTLLCNTAQISRLYLLEINRMQL